jgi:hypothetical protein
VSPWSSELIEIVFVCWPTAAAVATMSIVTDCCTASVPTVHSPLLESKEPC